MTKKAAPAATRKARAAIKKPASEKAGDILKGKKAAAKRPATTPAKAAPKPSAKRKPVTKDAVGLQKSLEAVVEPPRLRRAIFIDVENTSSEAELLELVEHLRIDRKVQETMVMGVGNWKALGSRFAQTLGRLGAQLIHTAPPAGVRDWSDLWIAVAVGRWLGHAAPGDLLDIVSDDRAFDAVSDAASAAGVTYRRISYRSLTTLNKDVAKTSDGASARPRRSRRRRGKRSPAPATMPPPLVTTATTTEAPVPDDGSHAASQDKIRETLQRLALGSGGWVSLDTLANTLRAEGFNRPPGSPRLLTRLRRIKDVELGPNGLVRLIEPEAA